MTNPNKPGFHKNSNSQLALNRSLKTSKQQCLQYYRNTNIQKKNKQTTKQMMLFTIFCIATVKNVQNPRLDHRKHTLRRCNDHLQPKFMIPEEDANSRRQGTFSKG